MKNIYILILCSLSFPIFGQSFEWIRAWGDNFTTQGQAISTDDSGYVYVTGSFSGTMDFDPGPDTLNFTSFAYNAYVCKYDTAGNLVWAKNLNASYATNVTVDHHGNVIIVGSFEGTEDLDPGPQVYNLTATSYSALFVCKLNHAGNFMWAKAIGGPGSQVSSAITCDSEGNIYLAGSFYDTLNFDQQSLVPVGQSDCFITKMDTAGNFLWINSIEGPSYQWGNGIVCDQYDYPYVSGAYRGLTYFSPSSGVPSVNSVGNDSNDAFIAKLDPQGVPLWLKRYGGDGPIFSDNIASSDSDYIYLTGEYWDLIDFDPTPTTSYKQSVDASDIFVSKLDLSGNLIWVKTMGGPGLGRGTGVSADQYGNVYISGHFTDSTDFDPGPGITWKSSIRRADIFLCKLNSDGIMNWVGTFGGQNTDYGEDIATDKWNNFYSTGWLSLTVDVDPNAGSSPITINGTSAAFIHKMKSCTIDYNVVDTVCQAYTTPSGKNTWTKSGQYFESVTVPWDCDTIRSFNITVLGDISYIDTTTCKPFTSPSQNYVWDQTGTYYDTLYPNGCQKIVQVNLIVDTINDIISHTADTLISLDSSATYQWIYCDSILIPGATGQSYQATAFGSYSVILSKLNCVDTSECIEINNTSLLENSFSSDIRAYPNPFDNELNIDLEEYFQDVRITISDVRGQLVYSKSFKGVTKLMLPLKVTPGVYLLSIEANGLRSLVRIIKQ